MKQPIRTLTDRLLVLVRYCEVLEQILPTLLVSTQKGTEGNFHVHVVTTVHVLCVFQQISSIRLSIIELLLNSPVTSGHTCGRRGLCVRQMGGRYSFKCKTSRALQS